jgi:hypothetical protein
MEVEILTSKIHLIKSINDTLRRGFIVANEKYSELMAFIESNQVIDHNTTDSDLYWILSDLRRGGLVSYTDRCEKEYQKEEEKQTIFKSKYDEAMVWKNSLDSEALKHLETIIQANRVICSAG